MLELLTFNNSDYFKEGCVYLVLDRCIGKYLITECHLHNGFWFSNEGLKYKMTSVLSVNCEEMLHKEVIYVNTTLRGKIVKFIEPDGIGVLWNQGGDYRKYGLPNFWNNPKNLKLLTHSPDDSYDDYIRAISYSKEASEIKRRDLEDNSDITRLKGLRKKDFDRLEKYHIAHAYLSN